MSSPLIKNKVYTTNLINEGFQSKTGIKNKKKQINTNINS